MDLAQFQQKVSTSTKPLVIDFWAAWCAPCRVTKPILEKLAQEFAEDVEFLAINADESQDILRSLKIFGIPTVVTYRGAKEVVRVVGAQTEGNYHGMFTALAEGKEVRVPLSMLDRMIRLGLGLFFLMLGFSNGNWLVAAIGGVVAFMGMYDRCPIWRAITGSLARYKN
ncbi:MAG: thioredoxin family protein [Chloroflexota bacterium]